MIAEGALPVSPCFGRSSRGIVSPSNFGGTTSSIQAWPGPRRTGDSVSSRFAAPGQLPASDRAGKLDPLGWGTPDTAHDRATP